MKGLDQVTFTTWLKKEEGFISKAQYDSLLSNLPPSGRRKLNMYYKEKYNYYLNRKPSQLEFEIK